MIIKVTVKTDGLKEALQQKLDESGKFGPVEVGSESEYAFGTEFGTDGLIGTGHSNKGKTYKRGSENPVIMALRAQLEKLYGLTGKKLDDKAKEVHKNRVAYGQIPDPFLRPAIYQVLHEVSLDPHWMDSHTTLDLAEAIVQRMKRIMEENRTLFSDDIGRKAFAERVDETGKHSKEMQKVSSEAMDSETSRYDGSEPRKKKGIQEGNLRCTSHLRHTRYGRYFSNTPMSGWTCHS